LCEGFQLEGAGGDTARGIGEVLEGIGERWDMDVDVDERYAEVEADVAPGDRLLGGDVGEYMFFLMAV
jgi:hypothetical protein